MKFTLPTQAFPLMMRIRNEWPKITDIPSGHMQTLTELVAAGWVSNIHNGTQSERYTLTNLGRNRFIAAQEAAIKSLTE